MIFLRLNHLMGNRRLKIADVCKDTKISRPTLTALYYGTSKGINFDTINKLCSYFGCPIEELIYFYDVSIDTVEIHNMDKAGEDSLFKGEIRFNSSKTSIGRIPFSLRCMDLNGIIGPDLILGNDPVLFPYLPDDLQNDFFDYVVREIIATINKKYPDTLPNNSFDFLTPSDPGNICFSKA